MKQFLTVGNWKMNTSLSEALTLAQAIKIDLERTNIADIQVVICPPLPWIIPISEIFSGTDVKIEHKIYLLKLADLIQERLLDLCSLIYATTSL